MINFTYMYYRRKIILSLLQLFDGNLEKIRLQKLLFLFSQRQREPEYEFVPYKFGCYSYSANADLTTMTGKKMLRETETHFYSLEKHSYIKDLQENDRKLLTEIKLLYGQMDSIALMKHTYINFPYYATKSIKAKDILTHGQLEKVEKEKSHNKDTVLYTIGYEGIALEDYLNRLLKNDVKLLIDVRNNPMSMKYGFSKSSLKRYCESLGIQYLHMPEVGIKSDQRQQLNTQSDYDKLFAVYRKTNLIETIPAQNNILSLLSQYKRVALTCFEANICQCHRKHLAEAIEKLPGFKYSVKHI